MIRPESLFRGARVSLIAPSGPVRIERLEPAIESVKNLGLVPVVYGSCYEKHGYLAGDDNLRAGDINAAFADPSIDGILCMRGGYGAQRILPLLDFRMIKNNPKFFCGYSDVTALHIVFNQICGFETYHTPMPATELYKGLDDYSIYFYSKMLFNHRKGELYHPGGEPFDCVVQGVCEGELTGGNLSVVVASLGTPYEIDTRNKIIFLEDIGEEVYSIDRMLTQLRNAGKLSECKGIILGQWTDCEDNGETSLYDGLTLQQVIEEIIVPEGKPCIGHVACGHSLPTMSLPMGAIVRVDAMKGRMCIR